MKEGDSRSRERKKRRWLTRQQKVAIGDIEGLRERWLTRRGSRGLRSATSSGAEGEVADLAAVARDHQRISRVVTVS